MEKEKDRKLDYIVEPLLKWYDKNRRILPWREEPTPYRVWVSEIMLQQTRVEAVKPYFARFTEELPNIRSLANVSEDRLLKLWEGLGYYNRVRNMQKAAIQMMEQYEGEMPGEYQLLLKLSGIGTYTAGAISSIAFGEKRPAVDGNVLRILSRLTMDGADIADTKVKKRVEEELLPIMPKRAGDFNQAMMELGATVCLPNGEPNCEVCPWHAFCEARIQGRIKEFPVKSPAKKRGIEQKTILIIRDGEKMMLHKRADKGLLAGMYEFPTMEGHASEKEALSYVKELGCQPLFIRAVGEAKHIFTHKEWHMTGFLVRVEPFGFEGLKTSDGSKGDTASVIETAENGYLLIDPLETRTKYPIPSAYAAYTSYADVKLTQEYIRKKNQNS